MTLRRLISKGICIFVSVCIICVSLSFFLPTRSEFSQMSKEERTKILSEVWDSRYDIMFKSKADDVVDEFFSMYHEMLLEDKELCQKENNCVQGQELY